GYCRTDRSVPLYWPPPSLASVNLRRLTSHGTPCVKMGASLGLLIALAGCGRHGKSAPKGGTEVPPSQTKLKRNVDLTKARRDSTEVFVEAVGYLEPDGMTPISAGVPGLIDEILCREGQWVERGTLLARVDQKRYEANAEVARANEKRAMAAEALARDLAE